MWLIFIRRCYARQGIIIEDMHMHIVEIVFLMLSSLMNLVSLCMKGHACASVICYDTSHVG